MASLEASPIGLLLRCCSTKSQVYILVKQQNSLYNITAARSGGSGVCIYKRTVGRLDGRTDGWTDGQTVGRTARRFGSAWLGPSRLGSARLGSARLGSAQFGPARLGLARLGLARLGLARLGFVRTYLRTDGQTDGLTYVLPKRAYPAPLNTII